MLLDNNASLMVRSFVTIPNKVTYAEIIIKNKSDIFFNTAKGKQKDIFCLNLYSRNKLTHECVYVEVIDNLRCLLSGSLPLQSEILLKVYFQTMDVKTIREIESISLTGALRFKGSAKYKNYEMKMNFIKSAEDEELEKKLLPMLEYNAWMDIFQQGGLISIITLLVLILFLVSIIIESYFVRLFLLVVALTLYIIAVPLNVAIMGFILKFNHNMNNK